jgi:hypothetical protein
VDLASSTPPPAAAGVPGVPSRRLLGEAGIDSARQRVHDCERPIRLRGSTRLVNPATGEIRTLYASAQELDGTTDDPDLPDGFELVTSWVFHGQGYLDLDTAAAAVHSAAMARIRTRA